MGKIHTPFSLSFEKLGPDDCWPWTRYRGTDGYGTYWIPELRKKIGAHRYAYILKHGKIPKGKQVCHHCDNPPCVNPDHLFLGTFMDNMKDMRRKRRHFVPKSNNIGSLHGMSILTEEKVINMLHLRASGRRLQDLADEFGITNGQVTNICNGKAWRHLTATLPLLVEECRKVSRRYRERRSG